ncbi:MAG: DUF2400 domain-containing protein [Bacteroidales bacterium]|jgi:hypothetical protein|nr:DUF2400 domain-containing protein [Bacteroidales bacterium]
MLKDQKINNTELRGLIRKLADEYDDRCYFESDPVVFPRYFYNLLINGGTLCKGEEVEDMPCSCSIGLCMKDIEIAGIIAAHLAWGRRAMIVRDCKRAFAEMDYAPLKYVMDGKYRNDDKSLHRTVKWSEFALICSNLREFYSSNDSLEELSPEEIRVKIYGRKPDRRMPNKKIMMMRRWFVRQDGIVDLGIWKHSNPCDLVIPLDVHVHQTARQLGITSRKCPDMTTAMEITDFLRTVFPDDPCKGDFALFGYGITHPICH